LTTTLSEISELFDSAEKKIKLFEHLDDGLLFSAVNQLRYVSFHILRYHEITDNDQKNEELRKAKNHCQRAIYDIMEIGLVHYLEQIRDFEQDYRTVVIADIVPTYLEINAMAKEVTMFLSNNTRKSLAERCDDRGDNYQESIRRFHELHDATEPLNSARSELNKRMKNQKMTLIISIFAAALTLAGVIIALLKS